MVGQFLYFVLKKSNTNLIIRISHILELSNNQECTKTLMKNRQKCDCDETIESEFNLKYLGSTIVTSQSGELVTTEAIKNILRLSRKKKWNNMQALVPVLLKVSIEGLSVFDPVTNCVKFHNSIYEYVNFVIKYWLRTYLTFAFHYPANCLLIIDLYT